MSYLSCKKSEFGITYITAHSHICYVTSCLVLNSSPLITTIWKINLHLSQIMIILIILSNEENKINYFEPTVGFDLKRDSLQRCLKLCYQPALHTVLHFPSNIQMDYQNLKKNNFIFSLSFILYHFWKWMIW